MASKWAQMGFKGARSSLRVEHYINIDDLRTFALFQIDWISYTPENAHVHTAGEGYWSAVLRGQAVLISC